MRKEEPGKKIKKNNLEWRKQAHANQKEKLDLEAWMLQS